MTLPIAREHVARCLRGHWQAAGLTRAEAAALYHHLVEGQPADRVADRFHYRRASFARLVKDAETILLVAYGVEAQQVIDCIRTSGKSRMSSAPLAADDGTPVAIHPRVISADDVTRSTQHAFRTLATQRG